MANVCQRSIYFADPDGNGLEIYYEMPRALELFPNGRGVEDGVLPLSGANDPLPQWLVEEWSGPRDGQSRGAAPPACTTGGGLTFGAKPHAFIRMAQPFRSPSRVFAGARLACYAADEPSCP